MIQLIINLGEDVLDEIAQRRGLDYPNERKVSRDEAVEATRYAIEALRMRLDILEKAPKDATFRIDPELLSRI